MGPLTFLSTSCECFKNLVCPETVIVSMLYDKELRVPDKASAVQIEKRVNAPVANPFNAAAIRAKVGKEKSKAPPPKQFWHPQIQVGKRIPPPEVATTLFPINIQAAFTVYSLTCRSPCRRRKRL